MVTVFSEILREFIDSFDEYCSIGTKGFPIRFSKPLFR